MRNIEELHNMLHELRGQDPVAEQDDLAAYADLMIARFAPFCVDEDDEELRYSPDQARDPDGKFGSGSAHEAAADKHAEKAETLDKAAAKETAAERVAAHKEAAAAHRRAESEAKNAAKLQLARVKAQTASEKEKLKAQVEIAKAKYKLYAAIAKLLTGFAVSLVAGEVLKNRKPK